MIRKRYSLAADGTTASASLVLRGGALLYGVICYLAFVVTFVLVIAFIGNLGITRSLDADPRVPGTTALVVDLGLIALFGLQHSIMARAGYKRRSAKIVATHVERSTYVLASSVILVLLVWLWQPIAGLVWNVDAAAPRAIIQAAFWCGWALVLLSSFAISHFDLFGLKQTYLHWRGLAYRPPRFRTPLLYRIVRHPMMVGMIVGFWAAPRMTVGHLLFAISMTIYILIGIWFEERDLAAHFGAAYDDYRNQTPMLFPFSRRARR